MTVLKKIFSVLMFLVSMTGSWAAAYGGSVLHVVWAWNLFAFMVWIGIVLSGLYCAARAAAKEKGEAFNIHPYNIVPAWVRRIESFFLAMFVAAVGHWFYGALIIIDMFLTEHAFTPVEATESQLKAL